jgi:hypothetical protein
MLDGMCNILGLRHDELTSDMVEKSLYIFIRHKYTDAPKNLMTDGFSACVVMWCRHIATYIKHLESGIDMRCIRYEELVGKPRDLVAALGKYVGVDFTEDEIESAVDAMKTRSQHGLKVGMKTIHNTGEKKEDCVEICRRMGAPSIYSDDLLPGTLELD